jgi:Glycoside hydrolase family 44
MKSPLLPLAGLALAAAFARADVHFTIDVQKNVHPISPYIYGVNTALSGPYSRLTLTRMGGNRWTCYNWTNNASNAGNDYHFQNDDYFSATDTPGAPVAAGIAATKADAPVIVTVPINGYVSADKNPRGDVRNSGPDYLQKRFRPEQPFKGAPFTLTPDPQSPVVYQDEFVNWVVTRFPGRTIFFDLDNEPAIWGETHLEVHPQKPTYAELAEKSIAYARAIKSVAPSNLIYGPSEFGWSGFADLHGAPDASEHGEFIGYYLKQMAAAEKTYGKRLLDVLDVHWYPEATGGGVRIIEEDSTPLVAAARLETPRSLWDSIYIETSWVTQNLSGPIQLLTRLKSDIAEDYPGTKLSVGEYNYGGGSDISGGVAEADVLGIFGREGLFSACLWPLADREPFIVGGLNMYLNYDGQGGTFGDTSVAASTDDVADTSVYASFDSKSPGKMVLIAVNKSDHPITAHVRLDHGPRWTTARIYQLTATSADPRSAGQLTLADPASFDYTMPPVSASALVLTGQP